MKIKTIKSIDVHEWNRIVQETYGRPYNFQQQDGCKDRGVFSITIPYKSEDDEMNDSIPEEVNGKRMGVKFKVWLERNPQEWNGKKEDEMFLRMFWERNFYPDIQEVANDLYNKGLIEAGDYIIYIDW